MEAELAGHMVAELGWGTILGELAGHMVVELELCTMELELGRCTMEVEMVDLYDIFSFSRKILIRLN